MDAPLTQLEYQEKQEMANVIDLAQNSESCTPDDTNLSDISGLLASGEQMRASYEQEYDVEEDIDGYMEVDEEQHSKKQSTIRQSLKTTHEIQKQMYMQFKNISKSQISILQKLTEQANDTNKQMKKLLERINHINMELKETRTQFSTMFEKMQKQINFINEITKTTKEMIQNQKTQTVDSNECEQIEKIFPF